MINSYLITDPLYYSDNKTALVTKLTEVYNLHEISFSCFRDKTSLNFKELAQAFLDTSRKKAIPKVLINTNLDLAIELGFDGIHLNSGQFHEIIRAKEHKLYTIISTHTPKEVHEALRLGADGVTFSPIFDTPNKGEAKGIAQLKAIADKYPNKIIALGGIISQEQINQIESLPLLGFASIRFFV